MDKINEEIELLKFDFWNADRLNRFHKMDELETKVIAIMDLKELLKQVAARHGIIIEEYNQRVSDCRRHVTNT